MQKNEKSLGKVKEGREEMLLMLLFLLTFIMLKKCLNFFLPKMYSFTPKWLIKKIIALHIHIIYHFLFLFVFIIIRYMIVIIYGDVIIKLQSVPFPSFARPWASLEFEAPDLQYYIEIHRYTRIAVLNLFIGT